MALVQYTDIERFLPKGMRAPLSKPEIFEEAYLAAEQILVGETGITVPASLADRPGWCVLPMAWLIAKLSESQIERSEAEQKQLNANYGAALELLKKFRTKATVKSNTIAGRIEIQGDSSW